MANDKQLNILKKDVEAWNDWRKKYPGTRPALRGADLSLADHHGADLSLADLRDADLRGVNLSLADVRDADLHGANLRGANLSLADFRGSNLSLADVRDTDLRVANLSGANLSGANLSGADLSGADLSGADLRGGDLNRADLRGADLYGVKLSRTNFTDLDLREVKHLEEVIHDGPSSIGLDTIYKSKGDITHKFLLGVGVPANFIENMAGLAGKAIEFYSCFISYTEADNAISEKLFYDLQAKEVRVWRWRERARTGEFMDVEINKQIRLHDKLVVICSGNSLHAEPVLDEIREALEKEAEFEAAGTPRPVLFPIRIDDYVFRWEHELADEVRKRFIGDFRNWPDAGEYKQSFDKLVADLNKQQDEE